MPKLDLEVEYNNRARVPEHLAMQMRWTSASLAARTAMAAELDQAYGPGERQRYDLFFAERREGVVPLVLYIHGGYWQRGDRKDYSFVARELVARGVDVAVASYTLCPEATVAKIIEEMRACARALWARFGCRPAVAGHSAGGQLAAALLATDWAREGGDVPADLVRYAYAISGVFELEPLVHTSMNDALRLTPPAAREASPMLWPPPPRDRVFVAAVGRDESQEFVRQSLDMAAVWSAAGVKAECVIVPGTNHFTIVDELARRESAMVARIADFAAASAK
jgi:arylformamidase